MNWGGFPIGFRFAVRSLTDDCRKRCWETVLASAGYADFRNMELHEAELDDPYAQMKMYIPIIASPTLGPSQKAAEIWRRDTALLGGVAFYRPFVQENYLELYATSRRIGVFLPDGSIRNEAGVGYLPARITKAVFPKKTRKALFISRSDEKENTDGAYADAMRKLSVHGAAFEIRRMNYTEGAQALYGAGAFRNALLYNYPYRTETGERNTILYALLPGGRCLADGRAFSDSGESRLVFETFIKSVLTWNRKGIDVLCRDGEEYDMPEGCAAVTDPAQFYGIARAAEEAEAVFCLKRDSAFLKERISQKLIEI